MTSRYSSDAHGMRPAPSDDFDVLFNVVPDAVLVVDSGGRILHANDSAIDQLWHLDRSHVCELNITEIISGTDGELLDELTKGLQNDRNIRLQAQCVRNGGDTFPADISVSVLSLQRGYLVFFVRDISIQRGLEKMIRELTEKEG